MNKRKNKVRGITVCDFKLCCKATVINGVAPSQNRHIDQRYRIESPQMTSHIVHRDKGGKNIQWGRYSLLDSVGKMDRYVQKNQPGLLLHHTQK